METENHHTVEQGKEAEVRCPICGAAAHVCARAGNKNSGPVVQKISRAFYRTRTCQGCCFSFSRLIIAEVLSLWLQPVLEPLFPPRRMLKSSEYIDQPTHVPSAPIKRVSETRTPAATSAAMVVNPAVSSATQIPFVVDPVTRMVRVNLECAIGDGEFGGEILAAASSLEQNLRNAADQIRALVANSSSSVRFSQESDSEKVAADPAGLVRSDELQTSKTAAGNSKSH